MARDKQTRLSVVLLLIAFIGSSFSVHAGVSDLTQKQAQKMLNSAVKTALKTEKQLAGEAFDALSGCIGDLVVQLENGTPPAQILEPLCECLSSFTTAHFSAQIEVQQTLNMRAGQLLGQAGMYPQGFLIGDRSTLDRARDKIRARSRLRLDQGLKLVNKLRKLLLSKYDFKLIVRLDVPNLEFAIPILDDIMEEYRLCPKITVLVTGSSLLVSNDGQICAAGLSFDPDANDPLGGPMLDELEIVGLAGTASLSNLVMVSSPALPPGTDNPPICWQGTFRALGTELDDPSLPEGNYLVTARQSEVVTVSTIGVP